MRPSLCPALQPDPPDARRAAPSDATPVPVPAEFYATVQFGLPMSFPAAGPGTPPLLESVREACALWRRVLDRNASVRLVPPADRFGP